MCIRAGECHIRELPRLTFAYGESIGPRTSVPNDHPSRQRRHVRTQLHPAVGPGTTLPIGLTRSTGPVTHSIWASRRANYLDAGSRSIVIHIERLIVYDNTLSLLPDFNPSKISSLVGAHYAGTYRSQEYIAYSLPKMECGGIWPDASWPWT